MENNRQSLRQLVGDLRSAYRSARRHKANTTSCIKCSMDIEDELYELACAIVNGSYAMRPSLCFIVSNPVLREVIAADFRDRIVHHYLYDYLNPWLERELIEDCYSCRDGKGTGYGVDRLEHHIRSCSQNYTRECWVLQLDISGYFMSINRRKLYLMAMDLMSRIGRKRDKRGHLLRHLPKHHIVEQLLATVILYDPMANCNLCDPRNLRAQVPESKLLAFSAPDCGMPIGNLTSQMFSNLYLNGFCQWVKRQLKVRHFGNYVDDSFYVSCNKNWLLSLVPRIDSYLQSHLGLHLNLAKTKLTEVRQGVTFLGIHIKPHRRYVKRRTLQRMRQQVRAMEAVSPESLASKETRQRLLASANSMLGILNHTRSFRLRKALFPSYPMYRIAYASRGMRKFVETECAQTT